MAGSTNGLGSSTPPPYPQKSGPEEESVNTGAGLSEGAVATDRQLLPLSAGWGFCEAS